MYRFVFDLLYLDFKNWLNFIFANDKIVSFYIFLGLIVGAFIRYTGSTTEVSHMSVQPEKTDKYNQSLPPDKLWLQFSNKGAPSMRNKTYAYVFRSEIVDLEGNEIDFKVSIEFIVSFFK